MTSQIKKKFCVHVTCRTNFISLFHNEKISVKTTNRTTKQHFKHDHFNNIIILDADKTCDNFI